MHTTMEDIARICGVTKMTVSRVLAGRANVHKKTREKVLSTARHLDYHPNSLAKSLNANRSGFIGVATPFTGFLVSDYFGWILHGCAPVLREAGMDFALFDTEATLSNDGAKLATLYRQRRVDGLLFIAMHENHHFLDDPVLRRVPMVMIGERPRRSDVSAVFCNDYRGIQLLCEYLYGLGHRRIAFVAGPGDLATALGRRQAYEDFCREHQLETPAAYIHPGDYSLESGRLAGLALLRLENRPTAIIAANDSMAFGVVQSATHLNLPVPNDLSVVGFDDMGMAEAWFPALTTINQPINEMARRGAEILMEAVEKNTPPTEQVMLDVRLVVRHSTAPPAARKRREAS